MLGESEHCHMSVSQAPSYRRTEGPLFRTLPHASLHQAVDCILIISFNKLINISLSLIFVSCSSKLTEPKEDVVRTSNLLRVGQKHRQ